MSSCQDDSNQSSMDWLRSQDSDCSESGTPTLRQTGLPVAHDSKTDADTGPLVYQIDEYRILKALGRGGMGQVFLGHDTLLDRPVAVKFLASNAPSERLLQRFLIEARALGRVQHPNIVAIYRVGITNGRPYLVSELVAGHSLDHVCKPLAWTQVLRIGLDVARGLVAVHEHGVLHRDLKPANIMLTPDGHAKLLDFGLAKLVGELREVPPQFRASIERVVPRAGGVVVAAEGVERAWGARQAELDSTCDGDQPAVAKDSAAYGSTLHPEARQGPGTERSQLTDPGVVMGTPAYMAPELWLGAPSTELSDIFMLGEVLYELCCGEAPYPHAGERRKQRPGPQPDAVPLQRVAPAVHPRLAALIDECLRGDPLRRPRSAAQVLACLEAIAVVPSDQPAASRRGKTRLLARLLPLFVVGSSVLSAIGVQPEHLSQPEASPAPVAAPRPRVAVLGLSADKDASATQASFARTFGELLDAELAAGDQLLVLPAALLERVSLDLKADHLEDSPDNVLSRLKRCASPDLVALGTLRSDPTKHDLLRLDVALRSAQSGQQVAAASVSGAPQEVFTLVATLGRALRSQLGLPQLSGELQASLRAVRPASLAVAELHADGRSRLHRSDAVGAYRVLMRVVAAEPDYSMGHLALSDAMLALGKEADARRELRRAFELSRSLPRVERSLIEARHHEMESEWPQAFALYRALRISFPDDVEYGLYLAEAQRRAGLPGESLRTLEELRGQPERGAIDPRLDLAAAKAQMDRSDFTAAIPLIARAAAQAEAAASPLLLAQALLLDSFTRANLNQFQSSRKSAERARDLFAAGKNYFGQCEAMVAQSSAYISLGYYERAQQIHEATLQILIGLGNGALTASHLGNMADLLFLRGKLDLAEARGEAGLLLSRQVANPGATLESLVILGQVALLHGTLARAEERLLEAQQELPSAGDPRMSAWTLWQLGELRRAQGRQPEAQQLHQQALATREQYHLDGFSAESQLALATLALESGQAAEAEPLCRQAMERFRLAQNADSAAWAQALLSLALAQREQRAEAHPQFLAALKRLSISQNRPLQLAGLAALATAAALYEPPAQDLALLRKQLADAIALAQREDLLPSEVELMVRLYLLEQPTGEVSVDRHALCALAERARNSGLARVAALAAPLCRQNERSPHD